ncbi:MAG: glycosyltransferase family 2 protein [Patescibacteria group bacterium]
MMTSPNEKVIAVIPAYNEAKTIRRVIEGLRPYVSSVVVVNDASKDETENEAHAAGATVVSHKVNQGYDTTINDGFKKAAEEGATIILTFDADGEHEPTDVPRILAPIREGKADLVLGQRPESRHFGERVLASYTKARYGIPDPLCGLKAYKREIYNRVGFFDSVSSIGSELSLRAIRLGYNPALVPITLHAREVGDTSRFYEFNLRGNMRILMALWRILWI